MPEVIEYTDSLKGEWTDFVAHSSGANIAHQIGWRDVIARGLGHQPRYLMAIENSKITGVLPLFEVTTWWRSAYLVSLPWIDYGGICSEDQVSTDLLCERASEITRELGAEFMELRSEVACSDKLVSSTNKVTFLLPLEKDPDIVMGRFNGYLRNRIRKAHKNGLTATFGGEEFLSDFYQIFSRNMRDLGTPVWGKSFFTEILREFPDTARVELVHAEGSPIAGALVLSFRGRLYIPSVSALRSKRKLCPNQALYWGVIKDGCERGDSYFDFGRSSWESPTFDFKKKWVPQPTQLTWQYQLNKTRELPSVNPENPKYKMAINIWRKLPLPIANLLGPRVIRNFP